MAISDANKMLMLKSEGAIETLLTGLLLASPRRSEEGADELQEAYAALLLSLALCGSWTEVMRGYACAMRTLHDLKDGGGGTEATCRSAKSTLFELEGQKVLASASSSSAGASGITSVAKHVMMSYCWDQQAVIKRVHTALIAIWCNTWIDIEQMRGSTVDLMAAAVENAEVMPIGVSREYKESTNCRLEAQYAMQREVPTIQLMLASGYQADGWLEMLIGTRMGYGFHGAVLSDDLLFEGKVAELCRDLGERGQAGCLQSSAAAIVGGAAVPMRAATRGPRPTGTDNIAMVVLRRELDGLRMRGLRERAALEGVE